MIGFILMLCLCTGCYFQLVGGQNCTSFDYEQLALENKIRTETLAEKVSSDIITLTQQTTDALNGTESMKIQMMAEFNSIIAAGNRTITELTDAVDELANVNAAMRAEFNAKLEENNNTIEALKGQLVTKPNVSFLVRNPTTQTPGFGKSIKFTAYLSDTSGSYNKTSGKFTAPVNGTYLFNAQLCLNRGPEWRYIHYGIVAGGGFVANSLLFKVEGDIRFCNTVQAVVILKQGQTAEVRSIHHTAAPLAPNGPNEWNTFSGVLIREM